MVGKCIKYKSFTPVSMPSATYGTSVSGKWFGMEPTTPDVMYEPSPLSIMVMPGSETSVAAVAVVVKDRPQIMKFSVWCDYALLLQRGWLQWVMGGDMTWHITRDTWHVTRGTGHGAAFQCWNIIDELEELYHNYLQCALQLKCSNTQLTASNWIMGLGTSSGGKLAHSHATV